MKIATCCGADRGYGSEKPNNSTFKIGAYQVICNYMAPLRNKMKFVFLASVLLLVTGLLVACNEVDKVSPLFPTIKAWDLKSLQITDKDNRVLVFKRKKCVWTLGQEALATNEARVTELADQIIGISYRQVIAGKKAMYAEYMVAPDSFNYRVDIGLPEGTLKTLYLGSKGGSAATHAWTTEDENIYVLSGAAIKNITMASAFWLLKSDQ